MKTHPVAQRQFQRRLFWNIVLVAGAALLSAVAAIGAYRVSASRQALVDEMAAQSAIIATNVASAVVFDDPEFATQVLRSLRHTDIVHACLYSRTGHVFAVYHRNAEDLSCPPLGTPEGFHHGRLVLVRPTELDGTQVGTLLLEGNTAALQHDLRSFTGIALLVALVSLLVALAVSIRTQRRVALPIGSLISAATTVKEDHNYSVRARRYASDELGQLTDTFNAMLSDIEDANRRVRSSEERYRKLYNTPLVGMFTLDMKSCRVLVANVTAARLFGFRSIEELIEKLDCERQLMRRPGGAGLVETIEEAGELRDEELAYLRQDGEQRWALFSGRIIPGKNHLEGAFVDVTDRKATEQKYAALESQLRHQQKLEAIGTLASGVAHEINNPIQAIMGFADLLEMDAAPGSESQLLAQQVMDHGERVAKIVRNLLAFSRQQPEHRTREDVGRLVAEAVTLVATAMRHAKIRLDVDIQPDLPPLQCHAQQIQQVLMNLIMNARDAINSYDGCPADRRLIRVCAQTVSEELVRLTVEDSGPGIDPAALDRVFDPFYTTKGAGEGTGLGLSVSHGIVADHGGRLWAESRKDEYTRFHVDVPADHTTESDTGAATEDSPPRTDISSQD